MYFLLFLTLVAFYLYCIISLKELFLWTKPATILCATLWRGPSGKEVRKASSQQFVRS